jgi:dihydrofolate reductase
MTVAPSHGRSGNTKEAQVAGKVLWHVTMSLDGYIAGAEDGMGWVFEVDAGPSAIADDVIETMGAILAGRRWYDMVTARYGPREGIYGRDGVYGGRWRGPIIVLTHRPSDVRDEAGVRLASGGIEQVVAAARAAAEGKDVVVFGPTIAEQCLEAGLLDEIVVHVAPLLLGDGVRLYGRPGLGRVDLERTAIAESGQLTDLRFRVLQRGSSPPATS